MKERQLHRIPRTLAPQFLVFLQRRLGELPGSDDPAPAHRVELLLFACGSADGGSSSGSVPTDPLSGSFYSPIPDRPRGMHLAMYRRLASRIEALEEEGLRSGMTAVHRYVAPPQDGETLRADRIFEDGLELTPARLLLRAWDEFEVCRSSQRLPKRYYGRYGGSKASENRFLW